MEQNNSNLQQDFVYQQSPQGQQGAYFGQSYPAYYAQVPPEVRGWNWGAFSFSCLWGIGNRVYITLLCLIPFFGVFWIFVCGAKGNEWAWKNNAYPDVHTFQAVQETWNRAGLVYFVIMMAAVLLYMLFIFLMMGLLFFRYL